MITLILLGALLALMAFPSWRLEMLKPEHSTFKVLVYLGAYTAFDLVVGLPMKGYSGLEEFGIIVIACAIMLPVLMLGEYYTREWWKVSKQ